MKGQKLKNLVNHKAGSERLNAMKSGHNDNVVETKTSTVLYLDPGIIEANAENVRSTFKSRAELEKYTKSINWPFKRERVDVVQVVEWLNENELPNDKMWGYFRNIVQLGVSILESGQEQPITITESAGNYRSVTGSTRLLATWLFGQTVACMTRTYDNEKKEAESHLIENILKNDLSTYETIKGLSGYLEEIDADGEDNVTILMTKFGYKKSHAYRLVKIIKEVNKRGAFFNWLESHQDVSFREILAKIDGKDKGTSSSTETSKVKRSNSIVQIKGTKSDIPQQARTILINMKVEILLGQSSDSPEYKAMARNLIDYLENHQIDSKDAIQDAWDFLLAEQEEVFGKGLKKLNKADRGIDGLNSLLNKLIVQ